MSKKTTISEILRSRAAERGERPAYVFLSYGETGVAEERLTVSELDTRARAIAASLQSAGAGGESGLGRAGNGHFWRGSGFIIHG